MPPLLLPPPSPSHLLRLHVDPNGDELQELPGGVDSLLGGADDDDTRPTWVHLDPVDASGLLCIHDILTGLS